ncbi:hypothetical protein [Caballeronia sp. LZ032]|uniref:hypothetical protein n=1 Tax=Caballeronia sp. LZ032 TaxID=3038565 RepID=UPI0028673E92|nr:hypothetical protein [Caballeronia sp. LZ032]MDR5883788.1 hypothetical protein [Caballeronia sp. LZ032]
MQDGQRETLAIVAGDDEPLVVPPIEDIDGRIETSDRAWREWTTNLRCDGPYRPLLIRSALALKFLLYSPSGAIAAAATTSLPESIFAFLTHQQTFEPRKSNTCPFKGAMDKHDG